MALTAEILFVNPDYLKRLTNLSGAVDDDRIVPSVIIAQDLQIQQILGTDLYEKIKSEIKAGTITGAYETLLDKYIRKATAWHTMVDLIPNLYVKMDNGSLVIRTSENSVTITEADLHREIERARQNAQFYSYRLSKYLSYNSGSFSEYSTNTEDKLDPTTTSYYQNGLTISGTAKFDKLKYLTS